MSGDGFEEFVLAKVLRLLLAEHHKLQGMSLTVDATVELSDEEWEVVWDALDDLTGDDFSVRLATTPEAAPSAGGDQDPAPGGVRD